MSFLKYQHVERFGTDETQDIELGECLVFPKIDGTNASLWFADGTMQAGSRNRHLTPDVDDNAGFRSWAAMQANLKSFFVAYPDLRLFGEWLVPHSLKTYRQETWNRFYVFDVMRREHLLPYTDYQPLLEAFSIDYIPPICTIKNGSYEQFVNKLAANVFLIEDGQGAGEGIVLKNYAYRNKYGRQTWAKIVTSEFKEKHAKAMGGGVMEGKRMVEEEIAAKYITQALCEKEHAKIVNEIGGWESKQIPRLLSTVYHALITEETWNFLKDFKNPTIDFRRLMYFSNQRVKQCLPNLF